MTDVFSDALDSLNARVGHLAVRLMALEAERDIRAVMMRYMDLCDTLGPYTPMEELGALFTENAVWAGKGARYGAAFGGHHGRAAILSMLSSYAGPVPHFAMNAHFLSSETIEVLDRTGRARGAWMMLQTSTYSDGRSDLRSARLEVEFAYEEGRWRIAKFETENIFSRPIDGWDDASIIPEPGKVGDVR